MSGELVPKGHSPWKFLVLCPIDLEKMPFLNIEIHPA